MPAPSAYDRRQFPGAAADTTISSGISDTDLSCALTSTSGWPDGSYTGGILCELYSSSTGLTLEKVWATARSSSTLTIVRGADGTTGIVHAAGVGIRPVAGAIDADEANKAAHETVGQVTTAGDLLVADGANSLARLAKGSNDHVLRMAAGAVGWGALPADSVGSSQIAANAVGNAELADDAVDSPEIADGAIDLVHMSANSVDSDQYVDGSIDTVHLGDDQVTLAKLAASAKPRWMVPFARTVGAGTADGYADCAESGVSSYVPPEDCAVVGISVCGDAARTSGSVTISVQVDLVDTGLSVTIDGSHTVSHYATQSETADAVTAGQSVQVFCDFTSFVGPSDIAAYLHLQAV